jgi:predicted TIM-barrel fold metal-dependent hydrolase
VWPDAEGNVRGLGVVPLHRGVPAAAQKDKRLYELLALIDLLRGGRARERQWAEQRIEKILKTAAAEDAP